MLEIYFQKPIRYLEHICMTAYCVNHTASYHSWLNYGDSVPH